MILGIQGKAFDLPEQRRAYTYDEQPGNVVAMQIGRAVREAMKEQHGDSIDLGLIMLRHLQSHKLGVFEQ